VKNQLKIKGGLLLDELSVDIEGIPPDSLASPDIADKRSDSNVSLITFLDRFSLGN